jgi:predicted nucleotidyltransferase
VLAALLLSDADLHVRAIAERAAVPYAVAQREIERLEATHLVRSTRLGAAKIVTVNEQHPLFPELRALLLKAYGPRTVLAEMLCDEPHVDDAFLFGSWAARYHGDDGAPPADVDVLVIGRPPILRIDEIEADAERVLGRPVQITVVARDEWDEEATAFVRTVRSRALVPLCREDDS